MLPSAEVTPKSEALRDLVAGDNFAFELPCTLFGRSQTRGVLLSSAFELQSATKDLFSSSGSCQSIERWAVLPTEHFSHNEDEYCSAKAAAQEQYNKE